MPPMLLLAAANAEIDWVKLAVEMAGGLALFLFGMEIMTEALKAVAGPGLRNLLGKLTRNRFVAAFTGAFVTAVIQSSSVTTVLVVGFISAGLMTLSQSVGVIMGANIGTTVTAQVIAFKVTKAALLLVAGGFAASFVARNVRVKQVGQAVMGLGLVFFGMTVMSEATEPLRAFPPFIDLMAKMSNPLLGIAVAAAFTALVQSSSATTGIIIVLASRGFITLEAGIALAFGANVGTCATAMLATLGKPRPAKQAAIVHVLFNVAGVLIWLPLIGYLAEFVRHVSPTADASLDATARLAAETPRQIANAHTVFNIANTLLLIAFTGPIAYLARKLAPDRPEPQPAVIEAKYLEAVYLETPALAFDRVGLELNRLGALTMRLFSRTRQVFLAGSEPQLDELAGTEDDIDALHKQIVRYLGKIEQDQLTDEETGELLALIAIANDLEAIGDLVETNIVALGRQRLRKGLTISAQTLEKTRPLADRVREALQLTLDALARKDAELAQRVVDFKSEINAAVDALSAHLTQRLAADAPHRVSTYRLETEAIEQLKRTYYFSKRIARRIVTQWGE